MKILLSFFLLICFGNSYARELQFNCEFKKQIRLAKLSPLDLAVNQSIYLENLISEKYAFFMNEKSNSGGYINFAQKIKSPLVIISRSNAMISFAEYTTSDNRFFVSLFLDKKEGSFIPVVMNLHAWNPELAPDIYAPTMSVGYCIQLN